MSSLRRKDAGGAAARLASAWPYFLFAAIIAFLFPEVIFGGKTFLGDPDRWLIQMPLQLLATQALRHHLLPFWDSYNFCGQFALGQANMSLFYPPNFLIFWLLPSHLIEATSIRILVEGFLALSCFYLFFLKVFSDRALAAFAAVTFCLSTGLVISYNVGHSPQYFTALVLLAVWGWRERDMRRNILFLSAALFLHISGGYLQHTTYVITIAFLISLFRELRRDDWKSSLPRLFILWGASMAAALMLDSIELVAMTDAHHLSNRVATSYRDFLALWGVPWPMALRAIFPNFLGDYHDFYSSALAVNHDEAFPAYAGLAAFFFSVIAALRARDRDVLPWLLMAVFLALASLNTPVAAVPFLIYQKAPLIHGRLARLVPLALAFLAPAGIRSFDEGSPKDRRRAFLVVCAIAVIAWFMAHGGLLARLLASQETPGPWDVSQNLRSLPSDLPQRLRAASSAFAAGSAAFLLLLGARLSGYLKGERFKIAAVLVLVADLAPFARTHTLARAFAADDNWYPRSALTDFLRRLPDKDDYNMELVTGTRWPLPALGAFNPNANIPYGLRNVNGYSNFVNRRYSELVSRSREAFRGWRDPLTLSRAIADVLSVKYVVAPAQDARFASFTRPIFTDSDGTLRWATVFAKSDAVPRIHLACRAVTAPDDMEGFLAVLDGGRVDLHREVLLPPGTRMTYDWTRCRSDPAASLDISEPAPGLITGHAALTQPALLALTQTYDPGWKAFVNGVSVPIQRANYAFQVVELPTGHSDWELRFRPVHYGFALWATGASVLFLAVLLTLPLWRR